MGKGDREIGRSRACAAEEGRGGGVGEVAMPRRGSPSPFVSSFSFRSIASFRSRREAWIERSGGHPRRREEEEVVGMQDVGGSDWVRSLR